MDSYSYYFLFPKCQTHAYTRLENGGSESSTQKLLTKYTMEEKNKHIICRPRSVRAGKNCARGLKNNGNALSNVLITWKQCTKSN